MSDTAKTPLAEFLIQTRKQLNNGIGMSQQELAEKSQVSLGTIASIESGQSKMPRKETLDRLAKVLKVESEYLWMLNTQIPVETYWGLPLPNSQNTIDSIKSAIRCLVDIEGINVERADTALFFLKKLIQEANPDFPQQKASKRKLGHKEMEFLKRLEKWPYE